MFQFAVNSKVIKIIYGVVLPTVVVLLLLGVASFNSRPHLLGSASADFVLRLMLTLWFCGLYIRLSRFSSFSNFPNKRWSKFDVGEREKYFYVGLSFLFSIGCGAITWWIIQWSLPPFSVFASVGGILNGLIILFPMATQYWVLKL